MQLLILPILLFGDPPWIPNVMVSDDPAGANQDEVCIAVWKNYLFAYFNDYRVPWVHAFFARSTNGGLSWEPNYQMPQDSVSSFMGDPSVAVDDTGFVYLCCCDFARNRVYLTRSTDLGNSWEPTKYVSPGISKIDKSWVATKGRNVYVTWDLGPDPVRHIYFRKSTDRGETFGPVIIVDHATSGAARWGPIPRELADGTILVSWGCDTRSGIDTVNGIYCARSTDGGNTFTEYLITNTKFRYNSSNPRLFVLPPLETSPEYPQDVYTVFNDGPARTSTDRLNLNIYFSRSTDGGITWSPRIKINDDSISASDTMQQFMPWMAVDYRGWIHVVWYDGRRHPPRSNRYDLFYCYSSDRGLTWSENERVTDTSFVMNAFCGDYIGIAVDSQYVYAAWCDTRLQSTAPDIYFSRRPLPGVEIAEETTTSSYALISPNPMYAHAKIMIPHPHQEAEVRIYTSEGRLIRRIREKGRYIVWDGSDNRGRAAPGGIYFCELRNGDAIYHTKIVKLR
ncbi:hypothetical protein DRP53_07350 [candidate division WOR-3 bacterium]|uniref:T9SS type A sorting domain-containing protein n=1 Tax=candidate division WOR-3 bacterium TaxID=2052148 RepID=A0A660SG09_UNCW3|nr:MAG: hypothetical protein DRP53_07350 [candidate division WOR-3 bacterium]